MTPTNPGLGFSPWGDPVPENQKEAPPPASEPNDKEDSLGNDKIPAPADRAQDRIRAFINPPPEERERGRGRVRALINSTPEGIERRRVEREKQRAVDEKRRKKRKGQEVVSEKSEEEDGYESHEEDKERRENLRSGLGEYDGFDPTVWGVEKRRKDKILEMRRTDG